MAKKKLNILITAGGTRESIDPVRYITNASTGRMGYAIARAATQAGHAVTLITAPTTLRPPKGAAVIDVVTSDEMFKAVKATFAKCDCLIMAAAVSDYKPAASSKTKIKKQPSALSLELKPTRDIAERKLKAKKLDMIVANAPAAIGAEKSTLYIKTKTTDWQTLPNQTKSASAKKLLTAIERL
jgi:phosphopantothenoylcysteine decarboxylase/phosphopantothenate--cysteine ligase